MNIKENEVFCCGKSLGKYNKKEAYFCGNCQTLMFIKNSPQKNLMKWV